MKTVKFDREKKIIDNFCPFYGDPPQQCGSGCPHFELVPAGSDFDGEKMIEKRDPDRIALTCSGMPVFLRVEK